MIKHQLRVFPDCQLGKWFTRDHTKFPILAAADDDGDTSEDDDGMWYILVS